MKLKKVFNLKLIIAVLIGGIIGYILYHFVGCRSGSCPIWANPYYSVIVGMFMGGLLVRTK